MLSTSTQYSDWCGEIERQDQRQEISIRLPLLARITKDISTGARELIMLIVLRELYIAQTIKVMCSPSHCFCCATFHCWWVTECTWIWLVWMSKGQSIIYSRSLLAFVFCEKKLLSYHIRLSKILLNLRFTQHYILLTS